ncbi:hypothetical protein LHP98_06370 [Rhodobacter sp. Har01]|uniref:hypothetical protein n=1 Tax=Rhodobacter sp. Har01 TaxID=2883999 RepID=UPI001D061D23|nr:hypothetical protein [Rhodobacter sp. Har01]MCB6177754.1 hypothetical protein [Rhodobacter sp. Har01]
MHRLAALLALALMTACAAPQPLAESEVATEPAYAAAPDRGSCLPGDDDGIGGTGCPVD